MFIIYIFSKIYLGGFMKKGFTLIELLAVIVILAIIMIIVFCFWIHYMIYNDNSYVNNDTYKMISSNIRFK